MRTIMLVLVVFTIGGCISVNVRKMEDKSTDVESVSMAEPAGQPIAGAD